MRTHVEFRSAKFPALPGEEAQVNPGIWGKRLAEYLRQKLQEQGIETGESRPEDWGWVVPIQHAAFPLWIGCGRYEEYADGYLVFIEPSKPKVRRGLFKTVDTRPEVSRVAAALDTVLTSDPDIAAVHWWPEGTV